MSLVHHEEPDSRATEREHELQGSESFRGDVEHLDLPGPDLPLYLPALLGRETGMERRGARHRALKK